MHATAQFMASSLQHCSLRDCPVVRWKEEVVQMLEMLEMLEMLRSSDGAVLFRDCPVVPWSKLARRSPAASPASRGMVHNALPSRGGRGRSVSLQNTVFIAVAQARTHNATKPGITGELCGLGSRGENTRTGRWTSRSAQRFVPKDPC